MFQHFLDAQAGVYDQMLRELRTGQKQSHWMWFILPQLKALGRSDTAKHFGLADLDEAKAYAAHSVLGVRLRECVSLANAVEGKSANDIFGSPDDLKFRSCLTLFARATGEDIFRAALAKYYGAEDPLTLAELTR